MGVHVTEDVCHREQYSWVPLHEKHRVYYVDVLRHYRCRAELSEMMEQLNYGGQQLRAHNKGMDTPLAARDIEKRADACLSYAMQHADIMRG
jgi:hypothetical protein